ncbi:FBP domain-containing protein [Cellulomonas sp. RIT-PI-Y]|uniref:FBP domain-containing protein n=1 Tax=Cellulomonas sp. RIT-PI-Y TaxID=3035297 RepID=UPI0021DAFD81|nr:FBP domain-containing protein [Cellulomonas sp. RIT-PI-Y]
MHALSDQQIRTSFVNASRREAAHATLPDLGSLDWDRLDYLGWRDRRAPLSSYVVGEVDGELVGVLLRAAERTGKRRKAVCGWCEDVVATEDVGLYVARRAGAPGRRGDTIGTLLCSDFLCSQNVRRTPTRTEAGNASEEERALMTELRIEGLRERSARFLREVARTR